MYIIDGIKTIYIKLQKALIVRTNLKSIDAYKLSIQHRNVLVGLGKTYVHLICLQHFVYNITSQSALSFTVTLRLAKLFLRGPGASIQFLLNVCSDYCLDF